MAYEDEEENNLWLSLGRLLIEGGLPLPKVYATSKSLKVNLIEDLGNSRLDSLYPSYQRAAPMYLKAIEILSFWHGKGLILASPIQSKLAKPYTAAFAYENEWNYFIRGLGLLGYPVSHSPSLDAEARNLCALAAEGSIAKDAMGDKVLIHRDFQSRNIMCHRDAVYILDWQGARLGPICYDLASILWDPYTDLDESLKEELIETYLQQSRFYGIRVADSTSFRAKLYLIAIVRLMQAIGAYAKLSVTLGKDYYRFISIAARRLKDLSSRDFPSSFRETKAFLSDLGRCLG
jgi:aminoglycoside/choline kinase family phosphotransferase